jgi:hypothetical protein
MNLKLAIMCTIALAAIVPTSYLLTSSGVQNPQATDRAYMLGHLYIVHKDPSGRIVNYIQTDNVIVNRGDDCALNFLIAGTAAGTICGTAGAGFVDFALGNSTTAAAKTDLKLGAEISSNVGTCCGLGRAAATPTFTASASNSNNGAKVSLAHTFTSGVTNAAGITISEAGLFNSTTQGAIPMTAHQVFGTITLANGDTLAVTWAITIN